MGHGNGAYFRGQRRIRNCGTLIKSLFHRVLDGIDQAPLLSEVRRMRDRRQSNTATPLKETD